MYFVLKILRFVVRLVLKPVLWPLKLVWRLLKRPRSDDDSIDTGWTEQDGVGRGAEATNTTEVGASTAGETPVSAGESTSPVAVTQPGSNAALTQFRRVLVVVGVISGLSAFVTPYVRGSPVLDGLPLLVLFTGLPLAITGICVWGLRRRRQWAWYGAMGWGALIIIAYFMFWFAGVVGPSVLLAGPTWGALAFLDNLGRLLGLVSGFSGPALPGISAVGIGAVVLITGYRARPGEWTTTSGGDVGTVDTAERGVTDEAGLAEPSGVATTFSSADVDPIDRQERVTGSSPPAGEETATAAPADGPESTTTDGDAGETAVEAASASDATESADVESHADRPTARDRKETDTAEADARESDPVSDHREKLTAADPTTRQEAVRSIADAAAGTAVAEQKAIDALVDRLENDDVAEVRVTACEALGQLGAETDRARALLKDYRLDSDSDVSRAASRALRNSES